ncbi:putative membrane protein [Clostridioides difficile CD160]|nr:putative membrane protein [Clostridioides difficile CD160]
METKVYILKWDVIALFAITFLMFIFINKGEVYHEEEFKWEAD